MATIERKPLPPFNSRAVPITEADRAEMIARANEVIDHYLNGPGSYFDAGPRKPLVSPFGDSTLDDLKDFKKNVIASKQFADDPNSILDSVIELIDRTIEQVEATARNNEGRDEISLPPPNTGDPIDDPRVVSPRALTAATPISLSMSPPDAASSLEAADQRQGIRHLSTRIGNRRGAAVFDLGAPAVPLAPPSSTLSSGQPAAFGGADRDLSPPVTASRLFDSSLKESEASTPFGASGRFAPGSTSTSQPFDARAFAVPPNEATPTDTAADPSRKRFLGTRIAGKPGVTLFDPRTQTTRFISSDSSDRVGNGIASPPISVPIDPYQPPQPTRPLGLFTGQPMPETRLPPSVFGLPDDSGAPDRGVEEFLARWIKPLLQ